MSMSPEEIFEKELKERPPREQEAIREYIDRFQQLQAPKLPSVDEIHNEIINIDKLIEKARKGNFRASLELLRILSEFLWDYCPHFPPNLINYFFHAFSQILYGEKTDDALNLNMKKGDRNRLKAEIKDRAWFLSILLMREVHKYTWDQIKDMEDFDQKVDIPQTSVKMPLKASNNKSSIEARYLKIKKERALNQEVSQLRPERRIGPRYIPKLIRTPSD